MIVRQMKNAIRYCFLSVIILVSCCSKKQEISEEIIVVDGFEESVLLLEMKARPSGIRILDSDNYLIGDIWDWCQDDSMIYLLDNVSGSLVKCNAITGKVLSHVCYRGEGPGGYSNPYAIDSDDSFVYVSDLATMRLLVYDKNFAPHDELKLPFAFSDFIKLKEGFLFCNLIPTSQYNLFVYTDDEGRILNQFVESNLPGGYTGGRVFQQDENGTVYALAPYGNELYRWSDGELELVYQIDFLEKNLVVTPEKGYLDASIMADSEDYAYNSDFFITDDWFIHSFLYKRKRYYNFYNRESRENHIGIVESGETKLPFFPRWQHGRTLTGFAPIEYVRSYFESNKMVLPEDTEEYVLIDYELE